jgi:hypothetical protein
MEVAKLLTTSFDTTFLAALLGGPRTHIVFQRPRRHYPHRPSTDYQTALGLSLPAAKISTSTKSAAAAATSVQIVMFIIEEWCAKGARV